VHLRIYFDEKKQRLRRAAPSKRGTRRQPQPAPLSKAGLRKQASGSEQFGTPREGGEGGRVFIYSSPRSAKESGGALPATMK
jgi:hypothetical protein